VCGVFGVLDANNQNKKKIVLNALSRLNHRGPDEWGVYLNKFVGLGHTRLSIIDIEDGQQPMQSSDYIISFNGEIYNYLELRSDLESQGYSFNTNSDTEVILKLYESIGIDCFEKLNGEFAILIWDKKCEHLIAARDRYGIRPLYALQHNNAFLFSSEMKVFDTLDNYKREINAQNLFEHGLFWNTLADNTVYKDILTIESGTFEVFNTSGRIVKERYYQVGESFKVNETADNFVNTKKAFKELLNDSVSLRLRSDVPVGTYLSGGIDSTIISQLVKNQTNHTFKTFSVAFNDKSLDESDFQKLASKKVNSVHHEVKISNRDVDDNLLKTIYHTERPIFRTAPIPLHLLSNKVKETNTKVVLTGEGADEILFGYDTFKELKILKEWKMSNGDSAAIESLKELYPHLSHYADARQFAFIKMYYEGFLNDFENEFNGLNIRLANNKIIEKYFNKSLGLKFDKTTLLEKFKTTLPANYSSWSLLQKNSYLEIKTLLQGYLLSSQGDRMAMSNSIEGRFPFLDHRVVEMAFSMPDDYKLKGFDQKHILKQAFESEIPKEITNRPKRPYMAPDLIAFIDSKGKLSDLASTLLSDKCIEEYGLFDTKIVKRFLNKFKNGVPENTGYRDNMVFMFLLTSQICQYWINNPPEVELDMNKCVVDILDM